MSRATRARAAARRDAASPSPDSPVERKVVARLFMLDQRLLDGINERLRVLNRSREQATPKLPVVSLDAFFTSLVQHGLQVFDGVRAAHERSERLVLTPDEVPPPRRLPANPLARVG